MKLSLPRLLRRVSVRLTLWYAGLLMLVVALLGTAIYVRLSQSLREDVDQQLRSAAQAGLDLVEWENGGLVWEGTEPDRLLPDAVTTAEQHRNLIRLVDASGRVLSASPLLSLLPSDGLALRMRQAYSERFSTARAGGQDLRILAVPVRKGGRFYGALEVATSLAPIERTLAHVIRLLGLAGLAALAASSGIGLFLARRALDPVAEITRAARATSGANLSARLRLPDTGDELSALAASFDEMLDRVESAYRRQREFAADASHELRTPLALIKGHASLSRKDGTPPAEIAAALAAVEAEADRMTRLVEDLLLLARLDTGRLVLRSELVGLDELVHETAARLATSAGERGVSVAADASESLAVRGDETALRRVLLNLAQNSLEHTECGSVNLRVSASGGDAVLEVTDTGCGIALEHQPRLFDRFYRVDPARPRGGAGLGLSLCREIVLAHGGQISLESEPGRGTRVTCRLPLAG